MSFGKVIRLSNGASIPQVGLATWLTPPKEVELAVEFAIRHGYRQLDLGKVYGNQKAVGAALKKVVPSVVKREDLFISSKLWNTAHRPELVEAALDDTLAEIGVDYLDLYLIQLPVAFLPSKEFYPKDEAGNGPIIDTMPSLVDTWKAMLALPKTKVKAVGVSNFTIEHLEAIITATGVAPVVNQIEAHPLLPQDELRAYCESKNIHIIAFSPTGTNIPGKLRILEHPVVADVARKLNATPVQVLIAWGAARGYTLIPKSVNEDRIKSSFQQVELSKEDYDKVTSIGIGNRTRFFSPSLEWDINVFGEQDGEGATHKVKVQ